MVSLRDRKEGHQLQRITHRNEHSGLALKDLNDILAGVAGTMSPERMSPRNAILVKEILADAEGLNALETTLQDALARLKAVQTVPEAGGSDRQVTTANSNCGLLSHRQLEILSWVAQGKSNNVIATILGISAHTVDTHLRRAFERLETSDRTVAAIRAVQNGWIPAAA